MFSRKKLSQEIEELKQELEIYKNLRIYVDINEIDKTAEVTTNTSKLNVNLCRKKSRKKTLDFTLRLLRHI